MGGVLCARHTKKFSSKKLGCSSTAHFSNVVAQHTLKIVIRVEGKKEKCLHLGLNQGPSDLQSDALPTELKRPCFRVCIFFTRPTFFEQVKVKVVEKVLVVTGLEPGTVGLLDQCSRYVGRTGGYPNRAHRGVP